MCCIPFSPDLSALRGRRVQSVCDEWPWAALGVLVGCVMAESQLLAAAQAIVICARCCRQGRHLAMASSSLSGLHRECFHGGSVIEFNTCHNQLNCVFCELLPPWKVPLEMKESIHITRIFISAQKETLTVYYVCVCLTLQGAFWPVLSLAGVTSSKVILQTPLIISMWKHCPSLFRGVAANSGEGSGVWVQCERKVCLEGKSPPVIEHYQLSLQDHMNISSKLFKVV